MESMARFGCSGRFALKTWSGREIGRGKAIRERSSLCLSLLQPTCRVAHQNNMTEYTFDYKLLKFNGKDTPLAGYPLLPWFVIGTDESEKGVSDWSITTERGKDGADAPSLVI